jgi:folate-binding protein YgfZ
MAALALHDWHLGHGASFLLVDDGEVAAHYGDWKAEHHALRSTVGVIDLSARSRLVLLGADRQKLLNGQVTQDIKALRTGQGCYAALVTPKAKMLSDLNVHALPDELLLDFEPGLSRKVAERLEKFILSDDVQIVDAAPHYGLLSVQGPKAPRIVEAMGWFETLPDAPLSIVSARDPSLGELYLVHHARAGTRGFDLYAPIAAMSSVAEKLRVAAGEIHGRLCGWDALEVARVEAGIPRYGADMDDTNLPPEAGIEERAISYTKGCYSGQEVIARIRTYGQVAKALRGLKLTGDYPALPPKGTRLFRQEKEVGYITTAVFSPALNENIALGYVRKECNQPGEILTVGAADSAARAEVVPLPFLGLMLA